MTPTTETEAAFRAMQQESELKRVEHMNESKIVMKWMKYNIFIFPHYLHLSSELALLKHPKLDFIFWW